MQTISKQLLHKDYCLFQQDPIVDSLNVENINYPIDNFTEFVFKPAKIGETVKCKVISLNKVFKEYMLVIETNEGYNIPLLIARKSKVLSSDYLINTYENGLLNNEINLATLEKSMFSSSSILFESLSNSEEIISQNVGKEQTQKALATRIQLLRIDFQPFLSGIGYPLAFSVYLPGINEFQQSNRITSFNNIDSINSTIKTSIEMYENVNNTRNVAVIENGAISEPIQYKNKAANISIFNTNIIKLITKPAIFDKTKKVFLLQMGERVSSASEFNFQLINELNQNYIVLQCGLHDTSTFICDYSYPLNALQAFSIMIARLN